MFKSVFFTLALLIASAVVMPQTAQAGLIITQHFQFEDGTDFGVISIDIDQIDEFGNVLDWQLFELFGFTIGESFLFVADFDPLDLAAGFSFLSFDVNDISGSFAFDGFWESAFGEGFMSIFATAGDFIDAGIFVMGPATISSVAVAEPAAWLLMLSAGFGLLIRRRQR